jgi:hypothetical protein
VTERALSLCATASRDDVSDVVVGGQEWGKRFAGKISIIHVRADH